MIYRNRKLLDLADGAPCMNCGNQDGTVVMAHSNQMRDGKARNLKSPDYRVAALCSRCHYNIDDGSTLSRAERVELWEAAHRKTIGWLFESGHLIVK